jgi:hypothetical protein
MPLYAAGLDRSVQQVRDVRIDGSNRSAFSAWTSLECDKVVAYNVTRKHY